MYNNIIVENLDKIQIIKLNRPKSLNALSKDLLKELSDCLIEADNNKRNFFNLFNIIFKYNGFNKWHYRIS